MGKIVSQPVAWCGIDVSAQQLVVALQRGDRVVQQHTFCNRSGGHQALIRWLARTNSTVRVSLEATGLYSLDLALSLHASPGIELAVLNPKAVCRFAETLRRSKTDPADALVLLEYSRRMPWQRWQPPSAKALTLRAITRRFAALTKLHTMEANRMHAAEASETVPRCVRRDLRQSLCQIERRLERLQREARELVAQDVELEQRYMLLRSIPGIGESSALQILGELVVLAPDLDVRQWVAHSGLDPMHHDSGSSVHRAARISRAGNRHLRRALYMPAVVGVRFDPYLRAFYEHLLERHKTKLQAIIAAARKLLHGIYGMFRSRSRYDGSRLFPLLKPVARAA
jgi:transposase